MQNYNKLILELLKAETPKQGFDNLHKILVLKYFSAV